MREVFMRVLLLSLLLVSCTLAQTEGTLHRGVGEIAVRGGTYVEPGYDFFPSFGLTYAMGVSQHFALTANYVLDRFAAAQACGVVCASGNVRGHEFTAGTRVSFPLRTVTPYAVGMIGALRTSVHLEAGGPGGGQVSAHSSRFVGGGGLGMDIRLSRHVGFQLESRVMANPDGYYYVRTMAGLYFRHR